MNNCSGFNPYTHCTTYINLQYESKSDCDTLCQLLDQSKLETFSDKNVTKRLTLILAKVDNIARKEENAGTQHFYAPELKD